jgi:hypothetical protein
MPDTKCPICQPDLPAAEIKVCKDCQIKIIETAAINAITEAHSDAVFPCITDPGSFGSKS